VSLHARVTADDNEVSRRIVAAALPHTLLVTLAPHQIAARHGDDTLVVANHAHHQQRVQRDLAALHMSNASGGITATTSTSGAIPIARDAIQLDASAQQLSCTNCVLSLRGCVCACACARKHVMTFVRASSAYAIAEALLIGDGSSRSSVAHAR
jgi:hypothetical protein